MTNNKCESCGKTVRSNDFCALLSGSSSGAKCLTHLCGKCAHNQRILNRMVMINESKLNRMDAVYDA